MEAQREKLLSEEPLLENSIECSSERIVDIKGVKHHTTGSWRACTYILVTQCFEELAYYGIQFNLVTFLKNVLHENNVTAARNYTNWQGTCYIAPLIGAIVADSYLGRYLTTVGFFAVYLVVSTQSSDNTKLYFALHHLQNFVLFPLTDLLILFNTRGWLQCPFQHHSRLVPDLTDSILAERLKKDSFFNWFFFAIYTGSFVSGTAVVWVQDHYGWVVGLGIPTLFIAFAIASFMLGSSSYRVQKPLGSPIVRVFQVIVAATRKWAVSVPHDDSLLHEAPEKASVVDGHKLQHTPELRFLDKAAAITSDEELYDPWRLCTVTQVEELKVIVGMLPIWVTGIIYFSVLAQFSSTFLEQGRKMNKQIGSFAIPAASLASFDAVSVIIWVPIYDRVLVPAARRLTGNARGLSELQRFGAGLVLSILVMAAAALVEARRLALAAAHGGGGEAPMSILWQVPQYFLVGASVVFACVGQTEFFYNEAPPAMRSLCSALALLTVALGSYLSSLVVTAVAWITTRGGGAGWIPDDLDDGHLDRFFWLLAAMSALNLAVFVYCARRYRRKNVY
ncbi:unnamed protein product [Urochloa humidicola]